MAKKVKKTTSTRKKAYAAAGVDVDLGNKVKSRLPQLVKSTHRAEVLGKIGGFGGLFSAKFKGYKDPILVSSIDGVGTKLKVAALAGKHNTIGKDLVNHCVDDIAVVGAEPIFFLDYIGTGRLEPAIFQEIIGGLVEGCREAGCALIGGETAQMPSVYKDTDYDLVGSIVGIVERKKMIDGSRIKVGDVLVGLPSSGLHTNGYSLAREVLFTQLRMRWHDKLPGLKSTVAEELLKTHVNYQPLLKKLSAKVDIKGLAHITGGGLVDNLPRIFRDGIAAEIQLGSWPVLPIFKLLTSRMSANLLEAYQVFNMGIGMVAIVSEKDAKKILKATTAYRIGTIVKGNREVRLVGDPTLSL